MNWTTPTAERRYFAGEYTTAYDENGWVPNRTCGHVHRTAAAACRCIQKPGRNSVLYVQQDGRIRRLHDEPPHVHRCQQCDSLIKEECECSTPVCNMWCSANCKAAFDL